MKRIIVILVIAFYYLIGYSQDSGAIQIRSENFTKLSLGMPSEEVISLLLFEDEINKNFYGGIFIGIGLLPNDPNSTNTYTGIVTLHEYQITLENSKLKEWKINFDKIGSDAFYGQYINKGILGNTMNTWSLIKGKFNAIFTSIVDDAENNILDSKDSLIKEDVLGKKPIIEWVNLSGGKFSMGDALLLEYRRADGVISRYASTPHEVILSPFKMSKFEVTIKQFKTFIDATGYVTTADQKGGSNILKGNSDKFKTGVNWKCDERGNLRPESEYNYPVIHVSWYDANAFAKWMGCRLPTEAEWEYSCRSGSNHNYSFGSCLSTSMANFNCVNSVNICDSKGEYRRAITPVGSFAPNNWGLCDMHGNVWEWCSDYIDDYVIPSPINPQGPHVGTSGSYSIEKNGSKSTSIQRTKTIYKDSPRTIRGGAWNVSAWECMTAWRESFGPNYSWYNLGFRLVSDK